MRTLRNAGPITAATSLYGLLIFLYPASFRREFSREMMLIFRDSSRFEQNRQGTSALIILWITLSWDLAATAIMERVKEISAISTPAFFRIAGWGGISGGLLWFFLAIAAATTKANGALWPYIAIMAPALILITSLALYLQGNHDLDEAVAFAVFALGSVALVLSGVLWGLDVQHPYHTGELYLNFLGTSIQGLGLVAIGRRFRSRGNFSLWGTSLIVLGAILFLPFPTALFIATDSARISMESTELIFGSSLFWGMLALQAIAWMILGAIAFAWPRQTIGRLLPRAG